MTLILSAVGYINLKHIKLDALQNIKQENLDISKITAEAIDTALWNLDEVQVRRQLESLTHAESFCGARVIGTQGVVFVDFNFPAELGKDKFTHLENIFYINPSKFPEVEEIIGTLEICSDNAVINRHLHDAFYKQLISITLILITVLAACYISMLILVNPLRRIGKSMALLSQTMEPISDESLMKENEIGTLTRSFNIMVTDLLNTYQQLTVAKEDAEKADAAKTEFLSNMSHELRTPMHAILSYSKMGLVKLASGEEDIQKIEKYLHNINTSGKRLLGLLNNLLDLAKMEAGKIDFNPENEDYQNIIEHTLIDLSPLLKEKNQTIDIDNFVDNIEAVFDHTLMIQVMVNLLSNAIKFSPVNSSIKVTLSAVCAWPDRCDALCCSIADAGPGIPSGELESIFDKFIQSSKTKTSAGGTGLGLSICREIILLHKGKIWAENDRFSGAVISFIIPKEAKIIKDNTQETVGK